MKLSLEERINALIQLRDYLLEDGEEHRAIFKLAETDNGWFTPEHSRMALDNIANYFLDKAALEHWVAQYPTLTDTPVSPKRVGLILAGNIPAVGFHDVLSVFISGHHAVIKLSDKDKKLIPFILKYLVKICPKAADYFTWVTDGMDIFLRMTGIQQQTKLSGFEAVIATGSDNSMTHFKHYFGKFPYIIRGHRNSVAVLTGQETEEELWHLSEDMLRYFGLGCRSVSKIFVPKDFDFIPLMQTFDKYKSLVNHSKYKNNYEYNLAMYMLNNDVKFVNECMILVEETSLHSRIATMNYEYYETIEDVVQQLKAEEDKIQCVVSSMNLSDMNTVKLGATQQPSLLDYADNVDTMAFLAELG